MLFGQKREIQGSVIVRLISIIVEDRDEGLVAKLIDLAPKVVERGKDLMAKKSQPKHDNPDTEKTTAWHSTPIFNLIRKGVLINMSTPLGGICQ